jgi:hypothetical protein
MFCKIHSRTHVVHCGYNAMFDPGDLQNSPRIENLQPWVFRHAHIQKMHSNQAYEIAQF